MKALFVGGPWDGLIRDVNDELTHILVKIDTTDHRYRLKIGEKKPVHIFLHESLSSEAAYFEIQYDIQLRKKVKQLIEELPK